MILTSNQRYNIIYPCIERDIKKIITDNVLHLIEFSEKEKSQLVRKKNQSEFLGESFFEDNELIEYLDFQQAIDILHKYYRKIDDNENFNEIINLAKNIVHGRNQSAHSRSLFAEDMDHLNLFVDKIFRANSELFSNTINIIQDLRDKKFIDIFSEGNEHADPLLDGVPIYDEEYTGWVGRQNEISRIMQLLKGVSPMISLVGFGGVGKTSLASMICRQVAEANSDYKFESIIWHTCKTEKITNNDIVSIKDAIFDSASLIKKIAEGMIPEQKNNNELETIINYLSSFRILLILDNIETVLDDNLIQFLDDLSMEDHKSKILITSRLPVEGTKKFTIPSFSDNEAQHFFRTFVNSAGINELKGINTNIIKSLVNSRSNNPLLIKVSLNSIMMGMAYEKAFEQKNDMNQMFDYCYKNILDFIENDWWQVIFAFILCNSSLTITQVIQILKSNKNDIEKIIFELKNLGILISEIKKTGTQYFDVSHEIKFYIKENYSQMISGKIKEMINENYSFLKNIETSFSINKDEKNLLPDDFRNFVVYSNSNKSAASTLKRVINICYTLKKLMDEVEKSESKDEEKNKLIKYYREKCEELLTLSKELNPEYSEVNRTYAHYYQTLGYYNEALKEYDEAIAKDNEYKNFFIWKAQILMRMKNYESARDSIKRAVELAPNEINSMNEFLKLKRFSNEYDEEYILTLATFAELINNKNISDKLKSINLTTAMRGYLAFAEKVESVEKSMEMVFKAKTLYEQNSHFVDTKGMELINRNLYFVIDKFSTHPLLSEDRRTLEIIEWNETIVLKMENDIQIKKRIARNIASLEVLKTNKKSSKINNNQSGMIISVVEDRGFGFIIPDNDQTSVFFHFSNLSGLSYKPQINDKVIFEIRVDPVTDKPACFNIQKLN